jgi:DNA-binding CsgD family transcriptional regulator
LTASIAAEPGHLATPNGRALVDLVGQDPSAGLCVGVSAPGGYGKTTLLRELDRAYAAAGVPVAAPWHPAVDGEHPRDAGLSTGDEVLLVDDAHLLDDSRLRELRRLAGQPGARMVVAYRPWPRSAALAELTEALRRGRPTLVLPPWGADQVRACLAAALGGQPDPGLVAFVVAQTRGVPRYVARLAAALATGATDAAGTVSAGTVSAGTGGAGMGGSVAGAAAARVEPRISVSAITPFAADLDGLDRDLRLVLLAVEAGVGLHLDLIGELLDRDPDAVAELLEAARATGMLGPDGTLVPLARHAVAVLGPMAHRVGVRQRLAALQLARGGPVLPLVRPLLGPDDGGSETPRPGQAGGGGLAGDGRSIGVGGAGMAAAFEAAGLEALGADPALSARLFAAAAAAGRPTGARRALATALAGDLDAASRLADQVVAAGDPVERPGGAYVAAVALAHRGQLARSVELYRWAEPGPAAGFAVVGLVGTGRLAEAQRFMAEQRAGGADRAGPPTLLTGAATLMARGVCESIAGPPSTALSALVQAATLLEPAGTAVLLPDSPAALAALLAVHSAELDIGEVLLDRAIATRMGGPLMAARHRLLQAWVLMVRGRTTAAAQRSAAVTGPTRLHGRDLFFAAALRVGLARRNSDLTGLRDAWPEACHALVGHPVDLFTLLPLGELAIAAARLGDQRRLAAQLAEADLLLRELGDPPLWSVPLHWSRLHAAIIAEQPAQAERHAAMLGERRAHSPYAAAVASAAQSWLAVLAGRIDPPAVEAAARGLATLGLSWDGARLAGQAAIRTPDRLAMTALLDCARVLQGRPADRRAGVPGTAATGRGGDGTGSGHEPALSEREQEVADLVLAGLTYKQIGDRLYISAKTVEHHMARMRQRLGCSDRRDLLARLRAMTVEQTVRTSRAAAESEVG